MKLELCLLGAVPVPGRGPGAGHLSEAEGTVIPPPLPPHPNPFEGV